MLGTAVLILALCVSSRPLLGRCDEIHSRDANSLLGVDWDKWASLNASAGGNLHLSVPFELPCFSSFEGTPVQPNPTACAVVQQNYTSPVFRSAHYEAYMNVSLFA